MAALITGLFMVIDHDDGHVVMFLGLFQLFIGICGLSLEDEKENTPAIDKYETKIYTIPTELLDQLVESRIESMDCYEERITINGDTVLIKTLN